MLLRPFLLLLLCPALFSPLPLAQANREGGPLRIAVLGDSLTAGYGLTAAQAFPAQLEVALRARGLDVRVTNAGVSGDTTAGGLARLDWTLADHPQLVIVELGANDALRGLSPEAAAGNLDAILTRLKQRGVTALLTGMRAPRNLGPDYYNSFNAIFPRLAREHNISFFPFFLAGVIGEPILNQADAIHPNPKGVAVIVESILPLVVRTIEGMAQDGTGPNKPKPSRGDRR